MPFALCLVSLSFLVATIVKSSRQKTRVWMSSRLAVLYLLDNEDMRDDALMGSPAEMEKNAREVFVKLREEGEGFRLVFQ